MNSKTLLNQITKLKIEIGSNNKKYRDLGTKSLKATSNYLIKDDEVRIKLKEKKGNIWKYQGCKTFFETQGNTVWLTQCGVDLLNK
jgi:hypothetical protein